MESEYLIQSSEARERTPRFKIIIITLLILVLLIVPTILVLASILLAETRSLWLEVQLNQQYLKNLSSPNP